MKPEIKNANLKIDYSRLQRIASYDFIGLHHTYVSHNQSVEVINNFHKNTMGWAGIGYHFYIYQNGDIYEGRPLHLRGAHIKGENSRSIGVCCAGNFDMQNITTDFPEQYKSLIKLLVWLVKKYPGIAIKRHTDFSAKSCPGIKFPFQKTKEDVRKFKEVDDFMGKYFQDVPDNHWAARDINEYHEKKLVRGIDEGVFGLGKNITREEVVVLNNRLRKHLEEFVLDIMVE